MATFFYFTRSKTHLLSLLILIWSFTIFLSACGDQDKSFTVGLLGDSVSFSAKATGLKEGLKALNYTEGKNITYQVLNIVGLSPDQQQVALKDFATKNYNAYWTSSGPAASLLKPFVPNRPIIVAGLASPVTLGLVQSSDRPGGNLTGIDSINTELTPKRMETLLSIDPTIHKAYFLYDTNIKSDLAYLDQIRTKAAQLGITLLERPISSQQASVDIVAQFKASEAPAIIIMGIGLFARDLDLTALKSVVTREKLLMVGAERSNLEAGAIFSYGSIFTALGHQSAAYVDKVLHGSNPADLPVLQPDKLELVLNQKLADQIGLKFSAQVLATADDLVK